MDELGFGKRLATYAFTDLEMTDSIAALLDDQELRDRMKVIGENIRLRNGTEVGANVIEQVAREHLNKTNTN